MPQETELAKQVTHSPHSAYVINSHLVWISHYRKKVLVGPVEARLKGLLAEIATQYGFERLAVEVMPDRKLAFANFVHLFVSAPPKFSPAEIFRQCKGMRHTCRPSRKLKKEFADAKHPYCLRRPYGGEQATLWAEGDYVGTAGHVRAETIKRYSEESQKKSFQGLEI